MRIAVIATVAAGMLMLVGCLKKPAPQASQASISAPAGGTMKPVTVLPPAPPEEFEQPAPQPVAPAPAVTVKPAPAPMPPTTAVRTRVYVVRHKDTLWSIAAKQLGNGKLWKEIVAANPGLTPANLKAGQKINLPAK